MYAPLHHELINLRQQEIAAAAERHRRQRPELLIPAPRPRGQIRRLRPALTARFVLFGRLAPRA